MTRTSGRRRETRNLCHACAADLEGFGSPFGLLNEFFPGGVFELPEEDEPVRAARGRAGPGHRQDEERGNLLDLFADRAKWVLQRAAHRAGERGASAIDTEDLLAAVAEEVEVGVKLLDDLHVNPGELISYLTANTPKGEKKESALLDLSPRAKQAIELDAATLKALAVKPGDPLRVVALT
jgi:hypothetical protein